MLPPGDGVPGRLRVRLGDSDLLMLWLSWSPVLVGGLLREASEAEERFVRTSLFKARSSDLPAFAGSPGVSWRGAAV